MDALGDHLEAIKFFKQGLSHHDIFAWDGLGDALISLKNYTGASLAFGQVLSLPIPISKLKQQPGYVEAMIGKGAALIYLHNYKGALSYLNRALVLRPHDPDIYYNRGLAFAFLGRAIMVVVQCNNNNSRSKTHQTNKQHSKTSRRRTNKQQLGEIFVTLATWLIVVITQDR